MYEKYIEVYDATEGTLIKAEEFTIPLILICDELNISVRRFREVCPIMHDAKEFRWTWLISKDNMLGYESVAIESAGITAYTERKYIKEFKRKMYLVIDPSFRCAIIQRARKFFYR